jgi:hypothetical protein
MNYTQTKKILFDFTIESKISKYLFTDINRGPPDHFGCLDEMISGLPKYLNGLGACSIMISLVQLVLFILSVSICCLKDNATTDNATYLSSRIVLNK